MTCIASQSSKEILHDSFNFSPLPPANEVCGGCVSQKFVCPQGVGSLSRGRLCSWGSLSRGVSVQGGLCPGGVSVQGGLCPGESLSRGVSVREIPPYGYVRAVPIPLEYTLVVKGDCFLGNFSQMPYIFLMASTRL